MGAVSFATLLWTSPGRAEWSLVAAWASYEFLGKAALAARDISTLEIQGIHTGMNVLSNAVRGQDLFGTDLDDMVRLNEGGVAHLSFLQENWACSG